MTQKEIDLLAKYFYFAEERLIDDERNMRDRTFRRDLDSIDLLEHIIAVERLRCFREFVMDVRHLLRM